MDIDYIVVGQGLAGSAVAMQLIHLGKKVVVFDDPESNNSSRIAAGLFNPVTGKKMSKTWLADKIFPYLHQYYQTLEKQTGSRFFFSLPLYRPFISVEEQNEWMVRAGEAAYSPYVEKIHTQQVFPEVINPYGGLLLRKCGFVDTRKYIQAVSILIGHQNTLLKEMFSTDDLIITDHGVSYKQFTAKKIVWCTGVHNNKYFDWLPIRCLKGETLSIRTDLPAGMIINRGVYMVPEFENRTWRVGSTYNVQDKAPGLTAGGKSELEGKISELILSDYTIADHQWGFRPTTPDRRPILGAHPEFRNLIVFNGLGTKGVSLAPYFSEVLVHWLEKKGSIDKEVDIDRFKSLY
jgi:glycine oxidase